MVFGRERLLCSSAFIVACAFSGAPSVALAQQSPAAASPSNQIEEVVVTARRREEAMQSVPIAITALGENRLIQSNVTDLKNVARLAPGIQIQPQFTPNNAVFQIRGQVQTDTAPSIDPSVGVYFDDVYIARSTGSLVNLVDVSRVEVLKGPQGTLFGKNTTGGAIRIVSNRPNHTFGGYVSTGYESFDRWKLEGVLNAPINDDLAIRSVVQYVNKSGGYGTNTVTGKPIDTDRSFFTRQSVLWNPTDKLEVLVEGDYTHQVAGGIPSILRDYTFSNGPTTALEAAVESGLGFNSAAGAAILNSLATGHGARDVGTSTCTVQTPAESYSFNPATGQFTFPGGCNPNPKSNSETWGLLANISYNFDFATLRSISSYRHVRYDARYDIDGTVFAILDSHQYVQAKQWSQELLLSGDALDRRLDWTIGGLYFKEVPSETDLVAPLAALQALAGGAGTDTRGTSRSESYAAYAQATYKFTDKLSLTAGARYTKDKRSFDATAFNRFTNGTEACLYDAANGLTNVAGFSAPCTISQNAIFSKSTYTVSLNYQIDPDKLVYLRTSSGYRAGGFNPRINAPEVVSSFNPETVTDYELGLKADWFDKLLRTNLALFHSKGQNVQQTVNGISPTNGAAITLTKNIGTRTVDGVEAEIIGRPTKDLSLDASVTYLDARQDNPADPLHFDNVILTPRWAFNVGGSYERQWTPDFLGTLRIDVSYRSKMYDQNPLVDLTTGLEAFQGFYRPVTLLSARYTVKHLPSGVELAIYGRNLTNQIYEARAGNVSGLGLSFGNLAEPRVIGFEIKAPFGGGR